MLGFSQQLQKFAKIQMFLRLCRSMTSLGLSFFKSLRLYFLVTKYYVHIICSSDLKTVFSITRTFFSNRRSKQFWKQNTISNFFGLFVTWTSFSLVWCRLFLWKCNGNWLCELSSLRTFFACHLAEFLWKRLQCNGAFFYWAVF